VNRALRTRSGSSAKDLLLTVLGEFTLPRTRSLWTSTVVDALATFGVDERNARQAIARLADRDLVRSEKVGRRARWHLTGTGVHLLTAGTRRIYEFGTEPGDWDGRWLVVLCSVPENQRAKRHRLRSQLGFAGFGFIAGGVALTPHADREAAANSVLDALDLAAGAVVFRTEPGSLVATERLLADAWDLDGLAARYGQFVADFAGREAAGPGARFAALVELVHEWRRFPFVDPEIPPRLLPPNWPGGRAKRLFDELHRRWAAEAGAWYDATEQAAE
jgi:phenylacetic acid degradation operon negative regulatory protein